MADVRIIGNGQCLKCGGKTEIKYVESFPFPDDEQTRTVETCQICDFEVEKSFSSTNATTAFDYSILEEETAEKEGGKI